MHHGESIAIVFYPEVIEYGDSLFAFLLYFRPFQIYLLYTEAVQLLDIDLWCLKVQENCL